MSFLSKKYFKKNSTAIFKKTKKKKTKPKNEKIKIQENGRSLTQGISQLCAFFNLFRAIFNFFFGKIFRQI